MSTKTMDKTIKGATQGDLTGAAQEQADIVGNELKTLGDAYDAYFAAAGKIGTIGLKRLAESLAIGADLKTGRPTFNAWHHYVMAVAVTRDGQRFDAKTQDDVLRHARKLFVKRLEDKGGLERADIDKIAAKFVKSVTKGDSKGGVSAKMTLAIPAAWEIAMG